MLGNARLEQHRPNWSNLSQSWHPYLLQLFSSFSLLGIYYFEDSFNLNDSKPIHVYHLTVLQTTTYVVQMESDIIAFSLKTGVSTNFIPCERTTNLLLLNPKQMT